MLRPADLKPGCLAGSFTGTDPWKAEADHDRSDHAAFEKAPENSVRSRVDDRWTSLWRRTDHLGFPVFGYQGDNPLDRAAEEADGTEADAAVGTHGDYPRTPAYREALRERGNPAGE